MEYDQRYRRFWHTLARGFIRCLILLVAVSALGGTLVSFRPAQAHTPPSTNSFLAQDGNTPPPPDDTPPAPPQSGVRVDTEDEGSNLELIFSLTFLLSIILMLGAGYYIIERSNRKEPAGKTTGSVPGEDSSTNTEP